MDEVRRQLEILDRRLKGRWWFFTELVSTSPLLSIAIGLIVGIVIQYYLNLSYSVWLLTGCIVFAAGVTICIIQRTSSDHKLRLTVSVTIAVICSVCLGGIRLISFNHARHNDIRNIVSAEPVLASIRGEIISEPYTKDDSEWAFNRFVFTDSSSSFYLKMAEAETTEGWAEVTGIVRVYVDEPLLDLKAGDYIHAYCRLNSFKPATNPGQFDVADYLAKRNVYVGVTIKSRGAIKKLRDGKVNKFRKFRTHLRKKASELLFDDSIDDEQQRGLLEALLLGRRGNIDRDTYRAFEKTGLLHFVSLSGMHLGILASVAWWLARLAGLLKRGRAIVCAIVIIIFLLVVPPRAPTIRAGVICFVFCAAHVFRRSPNPLNTLSLAALILLIIRPTGLFEAGWQLSFTSVLGILCFIEPIRNWLHTILVSPVNRFLSKFKYLFVLSRLFSYSISMFAVGFSAWLGGAGVLLYHFHSVNPFTCVYTVIAFPLVAWILSIGFIKVIVSLAFPATGVFLSIALEGLSEGLIWVVKFLSETGPTEILIGKVSLEVIVLYYAGIAILVQMWHLRLLWRTIGIVALICCLVIGVSFNKWIGSSELQMTVLDVGHGQAIVVRSPNGTNLFDAGSQFKQDIGSRVVLPFLKYNGIKHIDAIFISHDDIDHINGLIEIVQSCRVNHVYASEAFLNATKESSTAKFLSKSLAKEGLAIEPLGKADIVHGVTVLWPDGRACEDKSLSDNDTSIVSMIEYAGKRILLCSDIGKYPQNRLIESGVDFRADVVIAPHHGSLRTTDPAFLVKASGDYFICSCGSGYYARAKKWQIGGPGQWFFTAQGGAVSVIVEKTGKIKIITEKGLIVAR